MIKRPKANVVGIDADPDVLRIARQKNEQAELELNFQPAMVFSLPYRDICFDHVLSSLLRHHLVQIDKLGALRETFRVLHGGELPVADWENGRGGVSSNRVRGGANASDLRRNLASANGTSGQRGETAPIANKNPAPKTICCRWRNGKTQPSRSAE
jgi:SAM-dependent methyltransferase